MHATEQIVTHIHAQICPIAGIHRTGSFASGNRLFQHVQELCLELQCLLEVKEDLS